MEARFLSGRARAVAGPGWGDRLMRGATLRACPPYPVASARLRGHHFPDVVSELSVVEDALGLALASRQRAGRKQLDVEPHADLVLERAGRLGAPRRWPAPRGCSVCSAGCRTASADGEADVAPSAGSRDQRTGSRAHTGWA